MKVVVSNTPSRINILEETNAVFRNKALKEKYLSLCALAHRGEYVLSGTSEHCRQYLHLLLAEHGYSYVSPKNIVENNNYAYISGNHKSGSYIREKYLYHIKCQNKNLLDVEELRAKLLSKTALPKQPKFTKYLPKTVDWTKFEFTEGVWMIKTDSVESYGGAGNYIISSLEEWNDKKLMLKEMSNNEKFRGAVVSQYINNPLLDEKGRKTHFRCYLMVTTWGVHTGSNFWLRFTAGDLYEPYSKPNRKIHDSHLDTTETIDIFTEDTNKRITKGIYEIYQVLINEISKYKIQPYEESKCGYQILAPDIMFDANYKPYLLEVNTTPGMGSLDKEGIEEYEKILSTWEFTHGIKPQLKPTIPVIQESESPYKINQFAKNYINNLLDI